MPNGRGRQQFQERVVIDRFDEMRVETRLVRAMTIFVLPPARERHQQQIFSPWLFSKLAANLVAIETWQADVEQHDVWTQSRGGLDGLNPVMSQMSLVATDLQQHRQ